MCLVGFGLVLAGTALILLHQADKSTRRPTETQQPIDVKQAKAKAEARMVRSVLLWVLVLVVVFGVSTLALRRWSRHFRRWLLHQPHPPTPADDVWLMHRLPDEPPEMAGPDQGD